jgi:RimJ/RimL family protein N-acetyltransferase
VITTSRLVLRGWEDRDRVPFAAMGRDPLVMATLGPLLPRGESDAAIDRQRDFQARLGHCFWAIERAEDAAFLGFCGLKPGAGGTPIEHEIEIGWRLARQYWGQGYAREAAEASLRWGFTSLGVPRIMAITTPGNDRSWGLMERIGMTRRHDLDFDHPILAAGDPLRAHITYEAVAR